MFPEFSGGYYLGRFYVEARSDPPAAMAADRVDAIRSWLYDGAVADDPLVVRFNRQHFAVAGAADVADETISLPSEFVDASASGERRTVLLAKADVADDLVPFAYAPEDTADSAGDPFVPDGLRRFDGPS